MTTLDRQSRIVIAIIFLAIIGMPITGLISYNQGRLDCQRELNNDVPCQMAFSQPNWKMCERTVSDSLPMVIVYHHSDLSYKADTITTKDALYWFFNWPSSMVIYEDKAWWNIDWYDEENIRSYVKCYYNSDTLFTHGKYFYIKNFADYVLDVIKWESSFNPDAVSSTGAKGLMQLTSIAVKHTGYDYNQVIEYPWVNINCGVAYLMECLAWNRGHKANAWTSYRDGHWAEKDSDG